MRKKPSIPKQGGNVKIQHKKTQFFQGPIPTPEMLKHYNQIQPDFAERFMLMAEKEQQRTIAREKNREKNTFRVIVSGLVFAFCSIAGLIYTLIFAIKENQTETAKAIVYSMAAIGSIFILKKLRSKSNN